jgi:hypothetical protein
VLFAEQPGNVRVEHLGMPLGGVVERELFAGVHLASAVLALEAAQVVFPVPGPPNPDGARRIEQLLFASNTEEASDVNES